MATEWGTKMDRQQGKRQQNIKSLWTSTGSKNAQIISGTWLYAKAIWITFCFVFFFRILQNQEIFVICTLGISF